MAGRMRPTPPASKTKPALPWLGKAEQPGPPRQRCVRSTSPDPPRDCDFNLCTLTGRVETCWRGLCLAWLAIIPDDAGTVMAIAGHVCPKMLAHYCHARFQAKRTALDSLSTERAKRPNSRG